MTDQTSTRTWTTALIAVLEETFEKVGGIYLDPETSLFETLETVTAAEASRPISTQCASIAAQVNHICYYLEVNAAFMRKQPPASLDWAASWQVTTVTPEAWDDLRRRLRDTYQQVRTLFEDMETWDGVENSGDGIAIVVHTAYHLGEIRQGLGVLRG